MNLTSGNLGRTVPEGYYKSIQRKTYVTTAQLALMVSASRPRDFCDIKSVDICHPFINK